MFGSFRARQIALLSICTAYVASTGPGANEFLVVEISRVDFNRVVYCVTLFIFFSTRRVDFEVVCESSSSPPGERKVNFPIEAHSFRF